MNYNLKRVLAVLLVIIIAAGWYLTVVGAGPIKPIQDRMTLGLDIKGGVYVVMEAKNTNLKGDKLRDAMEQTQAVIEERVNQMGLAEPIVTIEGEKRIRVELPGAEDSQEAIEQIGQTAQLQFALADGTIVLDGSNVKKAEVATDNEKGGYAVALKFDSEGSDLFYEATQKAYSGSVTSAVDGVSGKAIMIILDGQIISAPNVEEPISGGSCSITGNFSQEDASNLAALINGGALPLELQEISSSVQSAKIGYNALEMSVYAGLIGLALIIIIMLVAYRGMGIAAGLALLLYVVIVLNIMSAMGSVLTLPGIAGIILSVGMAVDANVVIFSRIREEIMLGKTVRTACQDGFKRAMSTVIDSQVTTLIAAVILYEIGTSSVKGFAWTFMIGIVVSIFTAVVVTQLYINLMANSKAFSKKRFYGIKADNKATFHISKQLHFIKYRKIFYIISAVIMIAGLAFGLIRGLNYGIDFTGGTMIQMDMGKKVEISKVEDAIAEYNLDPEIIYSGEKNDQIVIRTIESLDNQKRAEVINSINEKFGTTEDDILEEELFGPSVGKELRNNAIIAVVISAICMLIYIRLRFAQWKFGGAAMLGVLHDVFIVLAFYAIFNVTVNNPFIAGILTVVGYSINDTIVVFDRIRENLKIRRSGNTEELIDMSITQTLGRSLMTSFTTIVVMIPLLIMAGDAIREFIMPLMVGIIAGAYSSIAICSPLYYEFDRPSSLSKYEKQVMATKKNSKKNSSKSDSKEKNATLPEESVNVNNVAEKTEVHNENTNDNAKNKNVPVVDKKRSKRYVKGNKK